MTVFRLLSVGAALLCAGVTLPAQLLDPGLLAKPATDSWPTFNGDYSGRRYSTLNQINQGNVKRLNLAWVSRAVPGAFSATEIGGEGPQEGRPEPDFFGTQIKSSPLLVNGVLYFTTPDNTYAADARTGRILWHYFWRTKGGIHIGNRGVGMWGNWLYFETPDDYVVSLDAKTGKERWHIKIADVAQEYFATAAPVVIGNHVIVGVGGDSLDVPGFLEARDPETGDLQWRWWTEPLKKGDPGADTWPNEDSMRHGGGMTWMPGTYDPETQTYYLGTGNPNPVLAGQSRQGDDLFTCTIAALDINTGKMKWHFQVSPHDTHDWDAVQTPVLFDAEFKGKKRKLLAQASRNGFFFLLDRETGEHLVTAPLIESLNWVKGINERGEPIRNPAKDATIDGVLVSPASGGATNWPAPSFDPDTNLFYVGTSQSFSEFYLTDTDPHPEGYGAAEKNSGGVGNALRAIDYNTGKTVWRHDYPGGGGMVGCLTTAGRLLFTGDGSGHLIAFDPSNGKILWHAGLGSNISNGPETYLLDGKQYVLAGAGDSLFAFTLPDE